MDTIVLSLIFGARSRRLDMPIVVMKLSQGDDAGGFLGFIKLQAAGKVLNSVGDKVFPSDRSLGTRIRMHACNRVVSCCRCKSNLIYEYQSSVFTLSASSYSIYLSDGNYLQVDCENGTPQNAPDCQQGGDSSPDHQDGQASQQATGIITHALSPVSVTNNSHQTPGHKDRSNLHRAGLSIAARR